MGLIRRVVVLVVAVITATSARVAAQTPPSDEDLARAKQLFQEGNELRKAGDCERALERFTASRALVPSVPNILNTAYCLGVLGRVDEALDAYAVLATDYEAELTADELAQIVSASDALKSRVGALDVVANVPGATLVVDARPRGTLPRMTPVRLLPGEHRIVVLADGYLAFSRTVTIRAGDATTMNVSLEPLAIAGRVRVEAPDAVGASVIVDGTAIGIAPWEGTLAAGHHWIALVRGDVGTAPTRVIVVDGQTSLVTARLAALGPAVDVRVVPPSARLAIDGVDVGGASFRGRLPLGRHRLVAREEGYVTATRDVDVTPGMSTDVRLDLAVDRAHPRWVQPSEPLRFLLEVRGGALVGPGLGSGAEASCDDGFACDQRGMAVGGAVELRGTLVFPFGFGLGLSGGYVAAQTGLRRARDVVVDDLSLRYDYEDRIAVHGPFVAVDASYRFRVGAVEPRAGLGFGVLFATASDEIRASIGGARLRAEASVERAGASASRVDLFVRPELGFGVHAGDFRFGIDVAVPVFLLEGPDNTHGDTVVNQPERCDRASPDVFCAPFQRIVAGERSYGPFVGVEPLVTAGYVF